MTDLDLQETADEALVWNGRPYQVGEKGLGTCAKCGKRTIGRTNDLCSRCDGVPVHLLIGCPPLPEPFAAKVGDRVRRGYRAEHYTEQLVGVRKRGS